MRLVWPTPDPPSAGPCHVVNTWAAIIIGAIGGLVYYLASKINLYVLKVDDPLDAIAVHAGCGVWGMLASGAFAVPVSWGGLPPGRDALTAVAGSCPRQLS